jgi:hypothetical protein
MLELRTGRHILGKRAEKNQFEFWSRSLKDFILYSIPIATKYSLMILHIALNPPYIPYASLHTPKANALKLRNEPFPIIAH